MPFNGDPLGFYGKRIIEEHHASLLKQLPSLKPGLPNTVDTSTSDELLHFLPRLKVGILGAGVGGLYTALILDSLNIEYEILEASNRAGGRISTRKFPDGGKYDYYEAGAMRFPLPKKDANGQFKSGTMKRLAELIEYGPLNEGQDCLKDKLIPYYFSARKGSNPGFYYFNGVYQPVSTEPKGAFNAQEINVHDDYVRAGIDAINHDVVNPFARMLIKDIEGGGTRGWEVLKSNDSYSVRAYMASKYLPSDHLELPPQHLPNSVINWCGLLTGSNGGYDRALSEFVFLSLSSARINGINYGDVDWRCFEGGSETLPKKMEGYIKKKGVSIQFQNRVTAIGQGDMVVSLPKDFLRHKLPSGVEEATSEWVDIVIEEEEIISASDPPSRIRVQVPCVTVTVNGGEVKNYSHVISTLPLPVLRTVDLNNAGLNVRQRNALRALTYGPSVKIAILFKSNWWTTKLGIVGGQSFTDLPIYTIVYPSCGVDSSTPSKVLIASYSTLADAERLSALAVMEGREVLKDLVLRNLAEAHSHMSPEITYEYLKDEFVDMDVKDWSRDMYAMGAAAYFSPGEFEDLYISLNAPAASNRLHFAGEAVSTRHAWVVGALDSAWKAVYQYLKVTRQHDKIMEFKAIWGENIEWTTPVDPVQYGNLGPDLLDRHLELVSQQSRPRGRCSAQI